MAVAFDAASDGGEGYTGTSTSWSHTCTGSDLALVVALCGWGGDPDGHAVTYNSVSMTHLGNFGSGGNNFAWLWGLAGPATGSNTIEVTGLPSTEIPEVGFAGVSFTGADQTTPFGTLAVGPDESTPRATISMAAGDLGVIGSYHGGFAGPQANSTERVNTDNYCAMLTGTGTGSVSLGYEGSGDAGVAAVPVLVASAGGGAQLTTGIGLTESRLLQRTRLFKAERHFTGWQARNGLLLPNRRLAA